MPTKIVYEPNCIINGSFTMSEDKGCLGFSNSNNMKLESTFSPTSSQSFEISFKVKTGSTTTGTQEVFAISIPILFRLSDSGSWTLAYNTGSWNDSGKMSASANTVYIVKVRYYPTSTTIDGYTYSAKYMYMEIYNSSKTLLNRYSYSLTSTYLNFQNMDAYIGSQSGNGEHWQGIIYFDDDTYIKIDNQLWWKSYKEVEVDVSGSINILKGYYNNGTDTIIMQAKSISYNDLTSGETLGCKNKTFAYSYNGTANAKITSYLNNDITTTHDVSVDINQPVYLNYSKEYIAGGNLIEPQWSFSNGGYTTNYTVVGSPTISDKYIASNFSSSNYISAGAFNPGSSSWEIGAKVHTKSSISGTQWIFTSYNQDNVSLCLYFGNPDVNAGNGSWYNGQVWTDSTIATDTDYWYKMTYDGTRYAVLRSTDGTTYTEIAYIADSRAIGAVTNLVFGRTDGGSFVDSIDLKTAYAKISGTEVWRAVSTIPTSITTQKALVYDNTNDTTYWYPSETSLDLYNFSATVDRCNLYLVNEKNSNTSNICAGTTPNFPDKANYTANGNLIINSDNAITNFTANNYISTPVTIPSTANNIITAIKISGSPSDTQGIIGNTTGVPNFYIHNSKILGCYDGSTSKAGQTVLTPNVKYWIQLIYDGTNTKFYSLQDNSYTLDTLPAISAWTLEFSFSSNVFNGKTLLFGKLYDGLPFTIGTIYMKDTIVLSNNEILWKAIQEGNEIDSYIQKSYVYLNNAHDTILGVQDKPNEIEMSAVSRSLHNFTKVGDLAISEYNIASGFSGNNYLTIEDPLKGKTITSFEYHISFNLLTGSYTEGNTSKCLYDTSSSSGVSARLSLKNGYVNFRATANGTDNIINILSPTQTALANTIYYIKATYDSVNGYALYHSFDDVNWILDGSDATTTAPYNNGADIVIGENYGFGDVVAWPGIFNLEDWYVKVNNEVVWKAVEGGNKFHCTVVGTPNISDDFIVNNFVARNSFLRIPNMLNLSGKDFEMVTKFNLTNTSTRSKIYGCADKSDQKLLTLQVSNSHPGWSIPGSSGSSWMSGDLYASSYTISANTWYWMKLICESNVFSLYMSTDGENWGSPIQTYTASQNMYDNSNYHYAVGEDWYASSESSPTLGSIDLKECYIKVDNVEIWRGAEKGSINAIKSDENNYWTYLENTIYLENIEKVVSLLTTVNDEAKALTMYICGKNETASSTSNLALAADMYNYTTPYLGYRIVFTDNTYSVISSLTKIGTRCRIYRGNYNSSNDYIIAVPVTQYEDGEITGNIYYTTFDSAKTTKLPISVANNTSSYTYNSTTDIITYDSINCSFVGEYYVNN